jgi:uncharacterized phiE125 gp8 family phage protein
MSLSVTNTAPGPAVALEDAREHLRIVGTADDVGIRRRLDAARRKLEQETSRILLTSACVYRRHAFPVDDGPMRLPAGPVTVVAAVKYRDENDVERTLDAAAYQTDLYTEPAEVWPAYGTSWPTTYGRRNAVSVEFTAGYGDGPDHVPAEMQEALLLLLGALWENRTDTTERPGQPMAGETAYAALADLDRVIWLGGDDDEDDSP